jgi:hypothetical protein
MEVELNECNDACEVNRDFCTRFAFALFNLQKEKHVHHNLQIEFSE